MARASKLLLAVVVACATAPAAAATSCQATPQGQLCLSQVDFTTFAQTAYQTQYQSQWCWAASISMLFAYYGHPVSQQRIVSETYGAPVNMPAMGSSMAADLNRTWTDDLGSVFHAQLTGAFDADVGINTLSNQQIAAELDQGRPLIVGNTQHAMVLTAMQYYPTASGPYVVAVGVFDPWPGQGARGLSAAEFTPMQVGGQLRFLATARVSDGPGSGTGGLGGGGDAAAGMGCSSSGAGGLPALLVVALILLRPCHTRLRHPERQHLGTSKC